ncbi:hypothetical protein ACU8KH_02474 [Lachancea thermotolerans]
MPLRVEKCKIFDILPYLPENFVPVMALYSPKYFTTHCTRDVESADNAMESYVIRFQ